MRLSLWLIAWAPLWLGQAFGSMAALDARQRDVLLARLLEHRVFAVREAVFLLKLAACLALFANDDVRARSRYDGPVREPRSLPLAGGTK